MHILQILGMLLFISADWRCMLASVHWHILQADTCNWLQIFSYQHFVKAHHVSSSCKVYPLRSGRDTQGFNVGHVKLVSFRQPDQIMWCDAYSKAGKCQDGWGQSGEWYRTFIQLENTVCFPLDSKHHQSFPQHNHVVFVPKRNLIMENSCIRHMGCKPLCISWSHYREGLEHQPQTWRALLFIKGYQKGDQSVPCTSRQDVKCVTTQDLELEPK